jgi:hypothetical protein
MSQPNSSRDKKKATDTQNGPRVMVHNADLFTEFINSLPLVAEDFEKYGRARPVIEESVETSDDGRPMSELMSQMDIKKRRKEQEQSHYFDKIKKQSEKTIKVKQDQREAAFVELYNSLIEERTGFIQDIAHTLQIYDESDERKKQQLYDEWCDNVFNPIQDQIQTKLAGVSSQEIERRRRTMFDKFLEQVNRKEKRNGGVFRDIIMEDDYDPLHYNKKHTIKYATSLRNDPVKKSLVQSDVNDNTKTSQPIGKQDMLQPTMWSKQNDINRIFNDKRPEQVVKNAQLKAKSDLAFDHYRTPQGYEVVKKEIPKGKRTYDNAKKESKGFAELTNGVK